MFYVTVQSDNAQPVLGIFPNAGEAYTFAVATVARLRAARDRYEWSVTVRDATGMRVAPFPGWPTRLPCSASYQPARELAVSRGLAS